MAELIYFEDKNVGVRSKFTNQRKIKHIRCIYLMLGYNLIHVYSNLEGKDK